MFLAFVPIVGLLMIVILSINNTTWFVIVSLVLSYPFSIKLSKKFKNRYVGLKYYFYDAYLIVEHKLFSITFPLEGISAINIDADMNRMEIQYRYHYIFRFSYKISLYVGFEDEQEFQTFLDTICLSFIFL